MRNEQKPEVISIGFDGPNRAGKGTQIELLSRALDQKGIPYVCVRGDGSRPAEGSHLGDPVSEWWTEMNKKLKEEGKRENWNESSRRLARELVVFRDRVLPRMFADSQVAFLIVDRSLISRTMVPRQLGETDISSKLYQAFTGQKGRKISPELVCPDVIFNLVASENVLFSRIDPSDSKGTFRRKIISETSEMYKNAIADLPLELRERVVEINAHQDPQEIHKLIKDYVESRLTKIRAQ
jgi:thymidylate kinase